jgi:peptidoglycan/xylan/chitin deacetylase (PgdA/CDA1 family)
MHKKIYAVALVLVFGSLFAFTVHSANAATNLVPNGTFETAVGTLPQSWTTDSWGTMNATFTYPVAGNASTKAAKVQVTSYSSGDAKWVFDHIPVTAGTTYTYSDSYIATVPTEIDVEYKASNGTLTYAYVGDAPATGSTWGTFSATLTPPAGTVSMTVTHIISAVGSLTLDNVSVTSGSTPPPPPPPPASKPTISSFAATPASITSGQSATLNWNISNASSTVINQGVGIVTGTTKSVSPTQTTVYVITATNPAGSVSATTTVTVSVPPPPPPTGNLIANGGLESGTGSTPTGWHSDYWGSMKPTFTYPVVGYDSARAAKITVTNWKSGDAKWWFDHVPVSSNTVYRFTENYLATAVTNVTVEFKMQDGSYQYQWLANEPLASGTAGGVVDIQITVPRGAISLTVLHALTSNGSLTIDNASLTALPANPFPTGMVTFTFDDGLLSQYTNARPILTAAGFKASYAIITQAVKDTSGDPAAMTWAQITQLKTDGNDIAAHTRTHADLTKLTTTQAQTEIKGSYDDLVAKGFASKSFVYPLGAVNPTIEQMVKNVGFSVARGSYWGMNTPTADKYALYDIRLDKTTTFAQAQAAIDQAFADKRWVVFEIHDVLASGGDDYAITPAFLQQVVNYVKQKGANVVTLQGGRALMQ